MAELSPYYQDEHTTLYCEEVFDILPELPELDAIITDPPYSSGGQMKNDRARSVAAKYSSAKKEARPDFTGDSRDQRSYLVWSTLWMTAAYHAARDKANFLVFTDWRQLPTITDAVQAAGWLWQGVQVWHKTTSRPRPNAFRADTEFVVWATKGPLDTNKDGAVYLPGIHKGSPPSGKNRVHTTQKSVEVMEWLCSIIPEENSLICDPFMGSGTTLVAARNLGHRCIGVDLSEQFCDFTIDRLQGQEEEQDA
jgi:site-specific DNA-methyltransferase (adenine-specific)